MPQQAHGQQEKPGHQETGTTQQDGEKPKQRGFRPDIQGMRAIAVGMVVIYHLWPSALPGGFAGVDVFFVISGFLITGHLLREYQQTGAIALVEFWGRRAKRLVPAAALVLTVTWVASRFLLPATRLADTAGQILASALYFQNWRLAWNSVDYLHADAAPAPVQHFWSLSVEEQFYLGWPLLFLVAALVALTARDVTRRRARGHRVVLFLAAAVVAGSLWYSAYYTHANPAGAYFVTTTRIWELGVGGLVAVLPAGLSRWIGRFGLLGWAGLGLVIASAFVLSGNDAFPGVLALLPVGGSALLILGGSAAGRFGPSKLTSTAPMVFIGGISYSLYLWHWPLIVEWDAWSGKSVNTISGAVLIVVSVLLSWATKVWVEDKVRTASLLSAHRWRSVSVALAAVVPVTVVTLFIVSEPGPWNGHLGPNYPGAAVLANKVVKLPKPVSVVPPPTAIKLPAYWQQGCLVAEASAVPKECAYGDTAHPVVTVALVGDSIAGDWFTPLQKIADERHWKLVTELHSVCPLTTAVMVSPAAVGGPYTACHDWGKAVVHDLVGGARYLLRRRTPAHALGIMAWHRLCYGAVFMASILISRNLLNDPANVDAGLRTFAAVLGATGVGFSAAVVLTPLLSPRMGPHRWIVLCLLLAGVSQLMLAVSVAWPVVVAGAALLGLAAQAAKIAVDTIVQRDTDDAYRGRAFSLYDVLYNAAFVGAAALGAVALPDTGWSRGAFVGLAVAYLLGAFLFSRAPAAPREVTGRTTRTDAALDA